MTHFVRLTQRSGVRVHVNPAQVLLVDSWDADKGESVLYFALVGRSWSDGDETATEPYRLIVTEPPEVVVADLERALLVVPPR